MYCLGRKTEYYYLEIFPIKELINCTLEFVLLMGVVAIQSKDNWNGIVNAPHPCEWDKDRLNPGDTVRQICPS
jgi:hypothetical protein